MTQAVKRLSIIGAGRLGTTLGRLFHRHAVFSTGDVLCRSTGRSEAAVQLIGQGRPKSAWNDLKPADIFLISVPDDRIRQADEMLAQTGLIGPQTVVFHCSGSLTSDELSHAVMAGAAVASIHPVMTFAEPAAAADQFKNVPCFVEGDDAACSVLISAFETIGGKVHRIDPAGKPLYHAALVFASNYLLALLNVSERLLVTAGLGSDEALAALRPLVNTTVANAFTLGLPASLTGPIVRGDAAVIQQHIEELGSLDPQLALLYRFLGIEAAKLAARRGVDAAQIEKILAR